MEQAKILKKPVNWNRCIFMFFAMCLPIANFFIFYVYTGADSYVISFQNNATKEFTFENYVYFWRQLAATDSQINEALINTLKFFLFEEIMRVAQFIVAFLLFKKVLGYRVYRIIFYLPALFSGVVTSAIFSEFIKPTGPLGQICSWLNISLPDVGLLSSKDTALATVFGYVVWVGFTTNVLMFTGAFGRIPQEVLEAAKIDGCPTFDEAFRIIFPMIMPTYVTLMILHCTGILSAGGVVQVMTNGASGTMTLPLWMFNELYGGGGYGGSGQYGVLAAGSISMALVTVPIILLVKWLTDKIPPVEY